MHIRQITPAREGIAIARYTQTVTTISNVSDIEEARWKLKPTMRVKSRARVLSDSVTETASSLARKGLYRTRYAAV